MVFHDGEAYWLRVTNLVQTVKGKASMVGVSLMRNALCWSSAPFPRSSLRHEVLPLGQGGLVTELVHGRRVGSEPIGDDGFGHGRGASALCA